MRLTTTLAAAAALAVTGVSATAGGLNKEIVAAPVAAPVMAPMPAEPTSSISPTFIVVGVLAALVIAAAVSAEDE